MNTVRAAAVRVMPPDTEADIRYVIDQDNEVAA
jgi:hypothetical protein